MRKEEAGTGRRREKEGGRNIHVKDKNINGLLLTHALTGYWTCNLGMCPDRESNLRSYVHGTMLQPTEPPGQGFPLFSLKRIKLTVSLKICMGGTTSHSSFYFQHLAAERSNFSIYIKVVTSYHTYSFPTMYNTCTGRRFPCKRQALSFKRFIVERRTLLLTGLLSP